MTDRIEQGAIKIIEIIGVSTRSFDDAVDEGIKRAAKSVEGVSGVEVMKFSAKVNGSKVTEYHANMKLAFAVR